ncbi:MAG: AAA family ATPase, partial [Deferribacterota bacterium]|nr:AAA family ATPase [Deferribacterota bacterium]
MIIEEFSIQRYGPIKGLTIRDLQKFNLFFGLNESGKTLTIDAIVKLLTGSNKVKYFESIDRVSEKPEGYLIIKCEKSISNKNNSNIIKLPDMGSLTKHKDLTDHELRNIFIIRDSDLTITKEDEFYTNITDKLTGLNTKYISIIKEKLLNIGKLTPSGEFRDKKGEKLNSRIKNANLLLERDIKELEKYSSDNNLFDIEEKKVSKKEEHDEIEQKIKELEYARLREMYEKTKKAFERVNYLLAKLKNLEIYNDNIMQLWIEYEKNIALLNETKAKLIEELRDHKKKLDETTAILDNLGKEMRILEEKKKDIDDNIKFEIKSYNEEKNNFTIKKRLDSFITYTLIISSIISAISIVGIILKDSLIIQILLIIFLLISFACGFFKFRLIKEKAKLETKFNDINTKLSKYSLGGKKIDDIRANIERFDEIYRQKYDEIGTLTSKKEALIEYIKAADKDIKDTDNKINNIKEEVEKIKFEYSCDNIDDYKDKLNIKRTLEKELAEQKSILNSYLNSSSNNLEENLKFWDKEIMKLKKYRDKAKGVSYSEELVLQLKAKKDTLLKQLDSLNEKTKTLNERLNNITRQANDILKIEGEDILYCNYLTDIEVIKDKIIKFINKNKDMKEK